MSVIVTISQITKKIIDAKPALQEALIEDIVNFANLAEKLSPEIESVLGEEVQRAAVVMAIRRYSEQLQKKTITKKNIQVNPEIIMRNNLCDICIVKTPSALDKMRNIHKIVDYEKGETFNVIQGNYEITLVISQKHLAQVKQMLANEKIINIEKNLVSLTLGFTKEFFYTPGRLSVTTRKLAWENINIFENISTMTELIFIVSEKDAIRAYNAFNELLREKAV